jgi:hypothetical protein
VNQKEGSTWEEKDENLRSVMGNGYDVDAFGLWRDLRWCNTPCMFSHCGTDWDDKEIVMNTVNAQRHYILSISTLNTIFSMFPACYELLLYGGKYQMPVSILIPCNFRIGK